MSATEPAAPRASPFFPVSELAGSPRRWRLAPCIAALAFIGVLATVTFGVPYPVIVFPGILLLCMSEGTTPARLALGASGAAAIGVAAAVVLAVTTYDQPWLYLPAQAAVLAGLIVLSRATSVRAGFILAGMVVSFAEPAYLRDPAMAIEAAFFNGAVLCALAWAVAGALMLAGAEAGTIHGHGEITLPPSPATPPALADLGFLALLVFLAAFAQMVLYNTLQLPEIRTGVIAVLLTADPDLRGVWRKMPSRQLVAWMCGVLAWSVLLLATPLLDDLAFFALFATLPYFVAGWICLGGPRSGFAAVPGAVTVTLVLLLDVRLTIDPRPSLLAVLGVHWGMLVTAVVALALVPLAGRHDGTPTRPAATTIL